ncbi:hypothetical protein BJ875DRAFT_462483 [Amylocarpus encephaloides]|uniref:C2H2-type domain-containing protein n=1 Tax=Amylocarpus encephaloides TaxID=45428 RepID=A0A9P8C527_9HELO|nr:hypothetical protein BJ875DRAFT_462483 [Amylocarpus encephaloides]
MENAWAADPFFAVDFPVFFDNFEADEQESGSKTSTTMAQTALPQSQATFDRFRAEAHLLPQPQTAASLSYAPSFDRRIPKRARIDTGNDSGMVERCYSQTGSQSTCCSSCSDGEPCTRPECEEDAISCTECACGIPKCSCPEHEEISSNRTLVDHPTMPVESRLREWNDSVQAAWNPQVASSAQIDNHSDGVYNSLEYNNVDLTSSASLPTPYSTQTALSTPSTAYDPHSSLYDSNYGLDPHWSNDAGSAFTCMWSGCDEIFNNNDNWLLHCFQTHVAPQMGIACPVQQETCPQNINPDPVNHLRLSHGYDFTDQSQGFLCPAPNCAPNERITNPTMLQTHLGYAHSMPTQGALRCEVQRCNNTFTDLSEFSSHLTHQHVPPPRNGDIDLSSQTGNAPERLTSERLAPEHLVPTTSSKSQEPLNDEDEHCCKWIGPNKACRQTFKTAGDLQEHIVKEHLQPLDKTSGYRCCWGGCTRAAKRGDLQSGFSQRGKLERHMSTHTNYKCCECPVCKKKFSAEQALLQHMNLHSNAKPWKCKHCDKSFPQQSACTIHERTHTKEKPLKCEICGKAFSESSNLSKHRKTHGERGAHVCTFPGCDKAFHRLDQLKRHKCVHARARVAGKEASASVSLGSGTETAGPDSDE